MLRPAVISLALLVCASAHADDPRPDDSNFWADESLWTFELTLAQAIAGDAQAQFLVAGMYRFGEGMHQDMAEAVTWYRAAARQGWTDAQHALAQHYERGEGVVADEAHALALYELAVRNGYPDATLRDRLATRLWDDDHAAALALADRWHTDPSLIE